MSKSWLACLLLVSSVAVAQEGAAPPEVKKTVDALVGNWSTDMTMTAPGQAPVKFQGTWECKPIAGGGAAECSLSTEVPGLGRMEETDLWGYDPETKSVHIMTWNNMGEVHDHRGAWTDDKTMSLTHSATAGGKPVEETFRFEFPGKNEMRFKYTSTTADGTTTLEGHGTRK